MEQGGREVETVTEGGRAGPPRSLATRTAGGAGPAVALPGFKSHLPTDELCDLGKCFILSELYSFIQKMRTSLPSSRARVNTSRVCHIRAQ